MIETAVASDEEWTVWIKDGAAFSIWGGYTTVANDPQLIRLDSTNWTEYPPSKRELTLLKSLLEVSLVNVETALNKE